MTLWAMNIHYVNTYLIIINANTQAAVLVSCEGVWFVTIETTKISLNTNIQWPHKLKLIFYMEISYKLILQIWKTVQLVYRDFW